MKQEFRVWKDEHMIYVKDDVYIAFFNSENAVDWALYDRIDQHAIYKHDSSYPEYYESVKLMERSPWFDRSKIAIWEGDILQLCNEDNDIIRVICEKGTAKRELSGYLCEINGWYFRIIINDKKTFPIIDNYRSVHDTEIMSVIGNIYQTPNLLTEK